MVRLPRLQFLGRLALVTAQSGEQRDHAGVDAGHQPIGFLPLVVAAEDPLAPAGSSAIVRPPLIEDQVEAGAPAVPALWGAATRQLRLLISRAIVAAERVSCSSRTLEQTTAFNIDGATNWRPGTK